MVRGKINKQNTCCQIAYISVIVIHQFQVGVYFSMGDLGSTTESREFSIGKFGFIDSVDGATEML